MLLSRNSVRDLIASAEGAPLDDATIQELLTAAVRLYCARVEANGPFAATTPGALTATEGMVATSALLRAVNVQLFELGLWQSWANPGVPR